MRDLDAVQEHESKQQELVRGIIDKLHADTRDDEEYLKLFYALAHCALLYLNDEPVEHPAVMTFTLSVINPIWDFTKNEVERKYLAMKVFEKLTVSISSSVIGKYTRAELANEILPA